MRHTAQAWGWLVRGVAFLSLLGGVFLSPALAVTRYVVPTGGATTGTCPSGTPCTFARGMSLTVAGDILYLKNGTYNNRIDGNSPPVPSGTSFANAPLIASAPGEQAIIQPSGGTEVFNLVFATTQYIIFDRLILDGSGLTGAPYDGTSHNWGIAIGYNAHHIRFQNGEVRNVNGIGVAMYGADTGFSMSQASEILTSKIHNSNSHGLYISSSDNLFDNNEVYDNAGYGLQFYNGNDSNVNNNTLRNNIFHGNDKIRLWGGAISMGTGTNSMVYNNILYDNSSGIDVNNGGSAGKVYNNTIYNNGAQAGAIQVYSGHSNAIIRNNLIYNNASGTVNSGSGTTFSNNLCSSSSTLCTAVGGAVGTVMVNAPANDFHLVAGSPAVNAGFSSAPLSTLVTTDIAGTARPQGPSYDIGAYEFGTAGGPATKLAFTIQPTAALVGATITPAVEVQGQDAGNVLDATFTGTVALTLGGGCTGLTGTTSTAAVAGKATFSTLAVSNPGAACQLTATSGSLTAATSAPFVITAQIAVASYQFENVLTDSSGQGNHASGTGSPTFLPSLGGLGQALALNGTTQYVSAPDATSLDLATTVSIEAWVNPSSALTNFHAVAGKDYTYVLYASSTGISGCVAGSPLAVLTDASSGQHTVCGLTPLAANTWTHLAMTYNGATLILYVAGANAGSIALAIPILTTTGALYVGAMQFQTPPVIEFFPGKLDNVVVYNYARSPAQIAADATPPAILSPPLHLRLMQ